MNERVKRWGIGVIAAAAFGFLGWQVAARLRHRGPPPPPVVSAPPETVNPGPSTVQPPPVKPPSRKAPKVLRDISRPEPVEIALATNAVRVRDLNRPEAVAVGPAAVPFGEGTVVAKQGVGGTTGVRLVADFEGAPATTFNKFSDTYWVIELKEKTDVGQPHFFLFRVEAAAGKTIIFQIRNAPGSWGKLNPVYSYAKSLDDPAAFISTAGGAAQFHTAPNGSRLPDTSGQSWHFIEKTELRQGTFSFTQTFDQDAYVCMRYPYTPAYNQRYFESLPSNHLAKVIDLGRSKEGRPLLLVKLGDGNETEEQRKQCVLIYARENPDEPDASWAAQGAIDFLVSNSSEARQIREKFTFLIIPILDPDGAARAVFSDEMRESYYSGGETPESTAYAAFFKQWEDRGNPLPLAINLHSTVPYLVFDALKPERFELAQVLCGFFNPLLQAKGIRKQDAPRKKVSTEFQRRFGFWLSSWYGTLEVPIGVNAQDPSRYLTIPEVREIGKLVVLGSAKYLGSEASAPLMASVDKVRRTRAERWAKYGGNVTATNAFAAELDCKRWADADADSARREAWQTEQLRKFRF